MGSAGVALGPLTAPSEELVEGHTVFTVVEPALNTTSERHFAAAVAVLVRQNVLTRFDYRFPGVLWFNDQYLTDPDPYMMNGTCTTAYCEQRGNTTRYPCLGAIVAVNRGDAAPAWLAKPPLNASDFAGTYVESYLFTDPNGYSWTEDKWDLGGRPVWTVGLDSSKNPYSDQARQHEDDGNFNCAPLKDGAVHNATGDNGYGYVCGGNGGPKCAQLSYNAVLYFLLDDLDQPGAPKNHTAGSTDRANDVSGCDDKPDSHFKDNWPCPAGNDDREGNSHAYYPHCVDPPVTYSETVPFPPPNGTTLTNECRSPFLDPGRVNHGGSDDCTGDGIADARCHATRYIDVYYGVAPVPASRNYVLYDVEGANAPYNCEQPPSTSFPGDDYCTADGS